MTAESPGTTPKILRGVFRRERRRTALAALCWSSHQVCEALVPVAFGLVIDRAVRTGDGWAMVVSVLGILGLFLVLTMSFRTGLWLLSRATVEEAHGLRLRLVRAILVRPEPVSAGRQTGEQLSIATSDALATAEALTVVAWLSAATVGLTTSAVILLRIDWVLALGILAGVPLLMLGLNLLGPWLQRRTAAQQETLGLAAAMAADLLQGLRPLRGFGGVPEAIRRYRGGSQASLDAGVGAVRASAAFRGLTTASSGLLLAAVAAAAGWFALQGRISVGELITVVGMAAFVSDPIHSIAEAVHDLATARSSAARVAEVLAGSSSQRSDGELSGTVDPALEVELIEVTGPGVADLTLRIEPGELVGVISGSVTTAAGLTGLLSGTVAPDHGQIRIGGELLHELTPAARRSRLLVEPHTVDLFGATLREALSTGDERTDGQLRKALSAAGFTELGSGPDLLDHALLHHGVNLSGGQRQRLAMARALVTDRPLLVFRDPTTAVDAVTETTMAAGIRHARSGRSTVLITTSPTLLVRCDRVVFLSGDEVHTGAHTDLLRRSDYVEAVLR